MSVNIVVPEVGESIVDARVAKWLKQEGDAVEAGEPVVELETDKIDVEVPAPKKGVLRSIAHQSGADVKIGDVLGTIEEGAAGSTGSTGSAGSAGQRPTVDGREPRNPPAKTDRPPRRRRRASSRASRTSRSPT